LNPLQAELGRIFYACFAPKETKWSILDEKESSDSLDHPEKPAL